MMHAVLRPAFPALTLLALSGCVLPVESDLEEAASPVIGGKAATKDHIYSTVALTDPSDGFTVCSGTLIAPTVVATAAHCVVIFADDPPTKINGQRKPSEIVVVAGALDADKPAPEQEYKVASITYHKDFTLKSPLDADGLSKENDIAVLILQEPISALPSAPALSIDQIDTNINKGTPVTISGYGIHNLDNQFTGTLYIAETPYQRRNATEFLAGGPGQPDTCTDDSGSPAYVTVGDTRYVAGVQSRSAVLGTDGSPVCGQGGVYTSLAAYDQWLRDNSGGAYSPSANIPSCKCRLSDGPVSSGHGVWLGLGLVALAARRRRGGR